MHAVELFICNVCSFTQFWISSTHTGNAREINYFLHIITSFLFYFVRKTVVLKVQFNKHRPFVASPDK